MILVYIALGGALGAVARYGVGTWFTFPIGTLVVNVVGSLLIGLALRHFQTADLSPEIRAFVTVGLLGGFTTFSTFSWEVVQLAQEGSWGRAFGYATASVALGVAAVLLGYGIGGVASRPR